MSKLIPMWWNSCLAVADLTENNLQVLVLEEKEEGEDKYYEWSESKHTLSSALLQRLIMDGRLIPMEVISNNDLWFHSNREHKLRYAIKAGEIKESRVLDTMKKFEYRPSLRRLRGMKPLGPGYVKLLELPGFCFSNSMRLKKEVKILGKTDLLDNKI